jgi:hypothetical protein
MDSRSFLGLFKCLINVFDEALECLPYILGNGDSFFGGQPLSILFKVLSDIDHGFALEGTDRNAFVFSEAPELFAGFCFFLDWLVVQVLGFVGVEVVVFGCGGLLLDRFLLCWLLFAHDKIEIYYNA